MRIENETMLHISRETNWKIGDKIIVGEDENPFWNVCRNFSPVVEVNGQKCHYLKCLLDVKVLMLQKAI